MRTSTLRIPCFLLVGLLALCVSCASPVHLTAEQASKLDLRLRPILENTPPVSGACSEWTLKDGRTVYGVIVRGSESEIRQAGFTPGSVVGEIVTLTVTADEILRLATLATVRSIGCGSSSKPQH